MTATPQTAPVRRLTVLYDPDCPVCASARRWLDRQRQLVPLDMVPCGSADALRRFPELDHAATRRDITVVGDSGQVYRDDAAWLVVLWALAEYRPTAHRLSTRAGGPVARAAVLAAARLREASKSGRSARPGSGARSYQVGEWTYRPATGWSYQSDAGHEDTGCGERGCPAPPRSA